MCVRARSAEANAMTSAWKHMVHFFCRMSISAIASVCAFASVCVCFSYSAASGLSPARSFNSNCRLFVWVCPYKHTISHVLCSQDYSWLWPQFSSGLLPGSLGGPCRQTSVLPESRKIRTTAHRLATTGKL